MFSNKLVTVDLEFLRENLKDKELEKLQKEVKKNFEEIKNKLGLTYNNNTIMYNNNIKNLTQFQIFIEFPIHLDRELLSNFLIEVIESMKENFNMNFNKNSLYFTEESYKKDFIKYLEASRETN